MAGKHVFTINLDGGTSSPLIRNPPSEVNIATINLDIGTINSDGGGGFLWRGGVLIRGGRLYYTRLDYTILHYAPAAAAPAPRPWAPRGAGRWPRRAVGSYDD